MTLQAHVSEVQHHRLSHRQPDQVDTLAVVGVVIRPVGRDDDAFTVSEGSTATGITWQAQHEIRGRFRSSPTATFAFLHVVGAHCNTSAHCVCVSLGDVVYVMWKPWSLTLESEWK